MKRILLTVALASISLTLNADPMTKPIRYTWIAESCDTWNCAAGALVLAGGDKNLVVLPTGRHDVPWVILRRVEEGSIYIPEDEPFACSVFTTMAEATAHFDSLDTCRTPLMLSVPDGRMVIASLQQCGLQKRRVTR